MPPTLYVYGCTERAFAATQEEGGDLRPAIVG